MELNNQAGWDRAIRIALGLLLLWLGWAGPVQGQWAVGCKLFGWVPLATGLAGWSPLYTLLGLDTRRGGARRR